MKFKRILSLLLVAMMLMASFASWAVIGTFAEEAAAPTTPTILTPEEAGQINFCADSNMADNNNAALVGWMGFNQPMSKLGYAIDGGEIGWTGQINDLTGAEIEIIQNLAGEYAKRYSITVDVTTLPYGAHVIRYYVMLEDGSIAEIASKEFTTKDPSIVNDSTYNVDTTVNGDLSTIFTFGQGLAPEGCSYKAAPYKMTGINQLITTANGTFALTLKNFKCADGHGALVLRGNPNPNFGDANYYGHDGNNDKANPDSLSVGCAGVYVSIVTEENAPVLRINVKGNEDGKAIPHVYKVALSSYDITVVDDNKALTFYDGDKVVATVEISGYAKGYATKAVVKVGDKTETLEKIAVAATANSDIGFTARSVDVTFDALKLTSLKIHNLVNTTIVTEKPDGFKYATDVEFEVQAEAIKDDANIFCGELNSFKYVYLKAPDGLATAKSIPVKFSVEEAASYDLLITLMGYAGTVRTGYVQIDDGPLYYVRSEGTEVDTKGEVPVYIQLPSTNLAAGEHTFTIYLAHDFDNNTVKSLYFDKLSVVDPTALPKPGQVGQVNASFDTFYVNGGMFFEADGGAGDKLDKIDNTISFEYGKEHKTMALRGWIGFNQAIDQFGYYIDSNEIVWGEYKQNTEAGVLAAGGDKATRFQIDADISGLSFGEHIVGYVVKLADGTVVLLRKEIKVVVGGPTTAAEIVKEAYALADGATLANGPYTLSGTIISIDAGYTAVYGNVTVTIAVDGADADKPIQAYRVVGEAAAKLLVGDQITVTGELTNYKGTIQFASGATLDKYEALGEAYDAVIEFYDKANRTELTNDIQVWAMNGITVTNKKADSTNNVADYADPIRLYKGSTLEIAATGMTSLDIICNSVSYAEVFKDLTIEGCTVTIKGAVVTLAFEAPVNSVTIDKLSAQTRISSIGATIVPVMWDSAKDIVMHQSFDELRLNGTPNGVFAPGQSAGWDKIANLGESDTLLQYWGWVATSSATIGTFGYSINGGKATFDPAWTVTPEFTVEQVFPTAKNATRMLINIDVADLVGTNDVTIYYMDDEGKITILNTFKVVKPEEPETPVITLGENAFDVSAGDKVVAEFYAKNDGTFTFTWAEGETNGFIAIEIGNETLLLTPEDASVSVELKKGEGVKVIVETFDYAADKINFVVTAEEPEIPQNPTLVIGDNAANVPANGNATYEFYAKNDGTFTLAWAEGETNGFIAIEIGNETLLLTPEDASISLELKKGDGIKVIVETFDYAADEINFVLSAAMPEVPAATELVVGENAIVVPANGLTVVLTASKDATYSFAWATGEVNGVATMVDAAGVATETALPLELTVKAGETITIILGTADFSEDTINIVVTEKDGDGDIFDDGKGCFGVIGSGSILAILALVPAAYALRRRKDEE